MTRISDLLSWDSMTFGLGPLANVTAAIKPDEEDQPTVIVESSPQFLDRAGTRAAYVQTLQDVRDFDVTFNTPAYADKQAVLQLLDFPAAPKIVEAYFGDPASPTLCQASVAVKRIKKSISYVVATCEKAGPTWLSTVNQSVGPTSFSANGALAVINPGDVRVRPLYRVTWTTQRASFSSTVGWRYSQAITITNNTDRNWDNEPMFVDLGDTAALVTGSKAISSGNDLRIWCEGEEFYRTLITWNTKRTQVCFLVSVPAGQSQTYYAVYGNSSAGTPRDLSTRTGTKGTYCAFDLEGYSGTLTAGSTTTATDGGAAWEVDRWKGGWIGFLSGTGAVRWRRIASNTSTVISYNRALASAPNNTTTYVIWMSGIAMDGGRVTGGVTSTAIQDTGHTNKWEVNEWAGATCTFTTGTANPATQVVLSNTADTLTFSGAGFSVANPTVNDSFTLQRLGKVSYMVNTAIQNTAHRGLYRINTYYGKPGRIWWAGNTPGGWMPETRNPNGDTYRVLRAYDTGSGGGHAQNFWPLLRAERKVKQDGRITDQGNGDGLSTSSAYGFQSWYWDYQLENNEGIGFAAFSIRREAGESLEDVVTDTTTEASLTAIAAQSVDLSAYDNPVQLYMGVSGDSDDEIPTETTKADLLALRTYQALRLTWDLDAFGGLSSSIYASGAEVEFYEGQFILRTGGGSIATPYPPYTRIECGGDGHRLMLPKGVLNSELWINPDPDSALGFATIYDPNADTWTEAPWACVVNDYVATASLLPSDSTAEPQVSESFCPILPSLNMVTNGSFATTITGWTVVNGGGVTAVASWDNTQNAGNDIAGGGSLKLHVTVTPVGAWTITLTWPRITVIPNRQYDFGLAARASNIGSSLAITETIVYANGVDNQADSILIPTPTVINTWTYKADGVLTHYNPPGTLSAIDNTTTADMSIVVSGTGSYVGDVWIDQVTFLGAGSNVYISESHMGTLKATVSFYPEFLG